MRSTSLWRAMLDLRWSKESHNCWVDQSKKSVKCKSRRLIIRGKMVSEIPSRSSLVAGLPDGELFLLNLYHPEVFRVQADGPAIGGLGARGPW